MCSEKPLSPPPPTAAAAAVSTTAPLRKTEEVSSFFAFVPSPFGACARKSHRYYFQIVLCLAICQQHYGLAKWTFSRNFSILFGIFLPSKRRMKADFFQEKRMQSASLDSIHVPKICQWFLLLLRGYSFLFAPPPPSSFRQSSDEKGWGRNIRIHRQTWPRSCLGVPEVLFRS